MTKHIFITMLKKNKICHVSGVNYRKMDKM